MNTDENKKLTTDILDSLKDCEPIETDTDSITFEKYNLVMDEICPIVQNFNVCIKECYILMNTLEKKLRDPKEIYKLTLKDTIKLRLKDYNRGATL